VQEGPPLFWVCYNAHVGAYLNKAREFHRQAVEELADWKRARNNDVLIRDAAEKAWGAVTQAANEVIATLEGPNNVPKGTNVRRQTLVALEKRFRELRVRSLSERFAGAENTLHTHCFYDGDYNPEEVEAWIQDYVPTYLDHVEEAINHPPRR